MFHIFKTPTWRTIAQRQLAQAQRTHLLEEANAESHSAAAEQHKAAARMYQERAQRLLALLNSDSDSALDDVQPPLEVRIAKEATPPGPVDLGINPIRFRDVKRIFRSR